MNNPEHYMFGGPPPNMPSVPIPPGYRRATPKEITKPVLKFANVALQHALPIGKQQVTTVTNPDKTQHLVMALTEVHWDNHPPRPKQGFKAYEGPEFLHPGISMLVPDFQSSQAVASSTPDKWPHRVNPFPTSTSGLPTTSSANIYAGEDLSEVIFQQALHSNNPQAVLNVAQAFNELGELGRANALMQHLGMAP